MAGESNLLGNGFQEDRTNKKGVNNDKNVNKTYVAATVFSFTDCG